MSEEDYFTIYFVNLHKNVHFLTKIKLNLIHENLL